jgi:acyl-CoA reductase-like NAD-dependent aldehyde dehydrogenase
MTTIDHEAFFIGGAWQKAQSDDRFDIISPRSEQVIGHVPAASRADIDAAVAAARKAFDEGEWPRLTPAERADYLTRMADAISKRQSELAELISEELGCTLFLSQVYQVISPMLSLNYNAEIGRSLDTAQVRISDLGPLAAGSEGGSIIPMAGASLVVQEPIGVVAAFPAYNFAFPAVPQKVGPAMIAGCTAVVKVTEPNPLATFIYGEICEEVGLPPGVLNIVAARGAESEYLVRHPGVDMVSFTGSVQTGSRIGAACGELIRPCVLELGGKTAAIVLEDARIEDVIPVLVGATAGGNAGQSCVALSRIVVPASQYDQYAEALVEAFRSLKVGDPFEADTVVSPLVTEQQRARVERYVEIARNEGATIATGGRRPAGLDRGWYYEPTLITDADNSMRSSREEIFGPVASMIAHNGEADAIRIANDNELGLSGAVFTADDAHGFEVAHQVRAGTFSVNTFAADLGSPFGGYKKSGIGREHGPTAYQEFLHYKTISVDPSRALPESVTAGVRRGTGPGIV